ncbi:hypothetical protein NPX13_g3362 [Xylaria arbuscula]|uniref:Uncharacterized protein n=1 Tax=Xylaria arbuscula TaxID=114810 RepID=A0A9W8NHF8_9PEZI|nr:hypothetical protein NPX13_g3362 [Xylaria arbuscula]
MSGKQPSGTRNALENTTRNGARHDPREPRRPHWITEDYYEENPWHNQNKYKPVFSLGQPLPRMVRWSRRESQNNGTKPNDDLAELGEVSSAGTSETESEASHKLRARHHHQTPAGVTLGGRFNDAGQPVHEYTPSNNQQGHARSGIEKQKNDGPDFGIDSEPLGKRETDEAEKPNSDLNDYRNWWARFRAKHPEPLAEFLAVNAPNSPLSYRLSITKPTDLQTFAGIFLGLAGNLSVNLSANQNQQYGTYETSCWAWGFAWMFGIYLGGGVSGAHMNPAISVSLSVFRGFPWRQCGIYIFAQFIASFAAAALVYGVYQDAIHYADPTMESTANSLFSSPNTSVSLGTACFSQIVGSAIMMVAVFALGDDQNNPPGAGMHALILGLLVTTLRFTLGYNIGSSFNPASDFGPRVITYAFGYREAEVFRHSQTFTICGKVCIAAGSCKTKGKKKGSPVRVMLGLFFTSSLQSRASAESSDCGFVGGYPLRDPDSCPSDAPITCGVGLQPRCCPSGFACITDATTNGTYCCENGVNCIADTIAHPQCPVANWNVWAYDSDGSRGWCCEPNYYGFATLANDGVGCQPIGDTIDTDTYHTVTQFFTSSVFCTSSSTTSSSIATQTTSSSTTSSPTESAPSIPASHNSGLGAGGIAGVVIGAVAGVAFIVVAIWLWKRRQLARNEPPATSHPAELAGPSKPSGYYTPAPTYEAPGASIVRYEMPTYTNDGRESNYRQT